jgi:thiol-disulfide isomerase/thioredoxin
MKYIFTLGFIIATITLNAQVKVLSLKELNKRISNGKDTTYVVNLWATWCAPCVEELPNFDRIHKENLTQPIKVILLSLDFKSKLMSDLIPFAIKHQLTAETYVIDEPNQQTFRKVMHKDWTGVIPTTLFINNKKKIKVLYEKPFTYPELNQALTDLK